MAVTLEQCLKCFIDLCRRVEDTSNERQKAGTVSGTGQEFTDDHMKTNSKTH
jgi:hypothetical protein